MKTNPLPSPKTPTLSNDLAIYLEMKESYLRPDSWKVYRNFGQKFRVFLELNGWAERLTKKTTPEMCEAYKRHILKMHSDTTTRNKEIGQMKAFFIHCTKPGYQRFKISPAKDVALLPKKDSELHEPYSIEQVESIFARIIEKRDYPLLLFIYFIHYTFSRPGKEVRLLKVGDLKARTALIRPENSKTRRTKTPTIPQPLEELICKLGIRNHPVTWFVFGNEDGKPGPVPVGRGCFYHRHKKVLSELGIIGKYTLYGWKHTGNIRAVQLGISERTLQLQNGFKEGRTLEIYLRRLSAYANDEIYQKFK